MVDESDSCGSGQGRCKTEIRSEIDIAAGILRVASKGAKKEEIMYRAELDYILLDRYLSALLELDFLTVEQKSTLYYRTTKKGLDFLHTYHRLKWLLWGETFDFLLVRLLGRLKK